MIVSADRTPDPDEERIVGIPVSWYMGAHGDPVAQFDRVALRLHPDGSVTWAKYDHDDQPIEGDRS